MRKVFIDCGCREGDAIAAFLGDQTVGWGAYHRCLKPRPDTNEYEIIGFESPDYKHLHSTRNRFSGVQSLPGDTMIASIPEDTSGSLKLEIDLEGFQPWIQPVAQAANREPLTINLTAAKYLPIQVKVENQQGRPSTQSRVQVELKRLGTTVDAPWGQVVITDERGNARIEHLRVGDTFRLRAWGQDGSTAVTEWKTMTAESEKVVTIKLSPAGTR